MTQTRIDWLKLRQSGIGGSDVAAILGLSKWRTPLDVYNSKVGEVSDEEDNASMEWGRRLEPVIRQAYSDKTGRAVECPGHLFRSGEHPFMIANVDGLCSDRVLEIKTSRSGADWGEEGTDEIPEYYLTQVQHYMTVTRMELCDVAVLIGASDFRIYTVKNDPELAALLIDEERKFWHLVETKTPPAPRSLSEVAMAFPVSRPETIEASDEVAKALDTLRSAREEMAKVKEIESSALATIQGYMGTNESLGIGGQIVATWKSGKPVARLDSASLKAKMPDIYKQFLKLGAPVRRFTLKAI